MPDKRYRESRTLARKITPVPGQKRSEFKANRAKLREHFEQFNKDASDLCQWLMAINPNRVVEKVEGLRKEAEQFWEQFLEPDIDDPKEGDRFRRELMDYVLGIAKTPKASPELLASDTLCFTPENRVFTCWRGCLVRV